MVLKFTPYRGKIEPVTKVHKAEVKLFPEFVEVIFSYEFEKFDDGNIKPDTSFGAHFFSKYKLSIVRTAIYHTEDDSKEMCQCVGLDVEGVSDTIYLRCRNNKEADDMYNSLKEYLLMV